MDGLHWGILGGASGLLLWPPITHPTLWNVCFSAVGDTGNFRSSSEETGTFLFISHTFLFFFQTLLRNNSSIMPLCFYTQSPGLTFPHKVGSYVHCVTKEHKTMAQNSSEKQVDTRFLQNPYQMVVPTFHQHFFSWVLFLVIPLQIIDLFKISTICLSLNAIFLT